MPIGRTYADVIRAVDIKINVIPFFPVSVDDQGEGMNFRFLISSACVAVAASYASASDLGVAKTFNAFIFGNASTQGGHADGAIAVGGSWTSQYDFLQSNLPGTIGSLNKIGGYVGGSMSFTGGSVNNSGNLYVGGAFSGSLNMNGGTRFANSPLVDPTVFTSQQAYSLAQSAAVAGMASQTITADPNVINIDLNSYGIPANGNQKVYTIAGSALNANTVFNITGGDGNETVIINVTGTSVTSHYNGVNYARKNRLIWNFADATQINVTNAFYGSILAPKATINQSSNIEGNLIAANWNDFGSPELHFGLGKTFDGTLPVPEPVSMATMGLGLFGLIARRRARR